MKNIRILLLLAEGFEFFEASVFIDVFGWNDHEGSGTTKIYTCGPDKIVRGAFNHKMVVDYTWNDVNVDEFDVLAVPGGFEDYNFFESAYDENYLRIVKYFNCHNKVIASICTGAIPIARSGVLAGRKATTYNMNAHRAAQLREMNVEVCNKPIVVDKNIISSWNPSTALDVAFLLLEKLIDKENVVRIKKLMGFVIR